jgi:hypothetical protein
MKITKLRKSDTQELNAEQLQSEVGNMANVKGARISINYEPNSYEETLAKKNKRPFVVKTTEVLVIE